jgi:hypothetical protein
MPKKGFAAAVAIFLAFALALPAAAAGSAAAQAPQASEGDADAADVVVLLDVSQSTLPWFQDVTDYVVSSVVKDYLRQGDTFHLLSFGETAQSEIAQRMASETDVKSVLGRLYLLYPLARYSDLVVALSYLYQYMADLPESRRKVVIMITDGVHNPPPSSSTYGMATEKVSAEIDAAAARIRANGWPVHIIKLPFPKPGEPGAPSSGSAEAQGKSYLDATASALGAEVSEFSRDGKADIARKSLSQPTAEFPGPLGKKDYSFSFPLRLKNGSESAVGLELDRVRLGDVDILSKKAFLTLQSGRSGTMDVPVLVPESIPQGESRLAVRLHFANGIRVSPDSGVLELTLARNPLAALLRSGARVALFAAVLALGLAALLGIVIMLRRMPSRAEAPIAAAVLQGEAESIFTSSPAAKAKASKAALGAAAASAAGERERTATAAVSAAAFAASRREEAARSAALLAEAARAAKAESRGDYAIPGVTAAAAGASPARGAAKRARGIPKRGATAHDEAIDTSSAALAAQNRAESERRVAALAEAAGRRAPAAKPSGRPGAAYSSRVVKPGSVSIELIVSGQNPHVGSRNVHTLTAGGSKSVGGGASDFLVFLVKVPRLCAQLHFDGEKLAFAPRRSELFPELSGPIEDCLGVEIPMISRSGYPLTLRFDVYEKPADKINKLLHCIERLGL